MSAIFSYTFALWKSLCKNKPSGISSSNTMPKTSKWCQYSLTGNIGDKSNNFPMPVVNDKNIIVIIKTNEVKNTAERYLLSGLQAQNKFIKPAKVNA